MAFIDYFFSGSKYIRVNRDDTGPGSVDAGYNPPQAITNWEWPAGFGADGIDAALYSGSKCFFFKGAEYVRVTRNGTVNAGQQDFDKPHPISEWGWGIFGAAGIDAALWSGPFAYLFKGAEYIRVTRTSDIDIGKIDTGYPKSISGWNFPGTFGEKGIKGALYSGSVCYFSDGPNYIRVQRGLEGAGFSDAPRAIKDVWGWPAGFGADGVDAALYSGGPLVPLPSQNPNGWNGNNNYFLWDNGNPLLGVKATVNIDETFASTDQGFSFQLNCWSQSGRTGLSPNWQQFIIWDEQAGTVLGAMLNFWITPDTDDKKHATIQNSDNLYTVSTPTTLSQGYQLEFAVTYDGNNVTGCIFTMLDKTGATLGTVNFAVIGFPNDINGQPLTIADTAPIIAVQFSIGGEAGDGQGTIAAGAAGTVTYSATNALTVSTGIPPPATVGNPVYGTGENATIMFGPLPTQPHTTIAQGWCTSTG